MLKPSAAAAARGATRSRQPVTGFVSRRVGRSVDARVAENSQPLRFSRFQKSDCATYTEEI